MTNDVYDESIGGVTGIKISTFNDGKQKSQSVESSLLTNYSIFSDNNGELYSSLDVSYLTGYGYTKHESHIDLLNKLKFVSSIIDNLVEDLDAYVAKEGKNEH